MPVAGAAGMRASSAAVMMAGIAAARTPTLERAVSMACSSVRPRPLLYDPVMRLVYPAAPQQHPEGFICEPMAKQAALGK